MGPSFFYDIMHCVRSLFLLRGKKEKGKRCFVFCVLEFHSQDKRQEVRVYLLTFGGWVPMRAMSRK